MQLYVYTMTTWTQAGSPACLISNRVKSRSKGKLLLEIMAGCLRHQLGGWFLTTEDMVVSKDLRRHVDWILERLTGKDELLKNLQAEGNWMDIFCLWLSTEGHGGPTLSPSIMRRLAELELEIGFDLYVP